MKKLMLLILVMLPVMAISQGNKICTLEAMEIVYRDTDRVLFEKTFPIVGYVEEVDGHLIIRSHWKERRRLKQVKIKIQEKKVEGNRVDILFINHENPYSFRRAEIEYLGDEVRLVLIADDALFGYIGRIPDGIK